MCKNLTLKLKKKKILIYAILLLTLLVITFMFNKDLFSMFKNKNSYTEVLEDKPKVQHTNTQPNGEMRAVWVPFMTLNMKDSNKTRESFKNKFDNIIDTSKKLGINTLIVHVRSHADAIYPSKIFPWSHLINGTQGNDPGFDPLEYMINSSHKAGLKFHAWVNPLRIQTNNSPSILCSTNDYNVWKKDQSKEKWVLDWNNDKYYNPAYPEVRQKIILGVQEIVENYSVDGIHFDDYFYPTCEEDYDKPSYDEYVANASKNGIPLPLIEWRKANINSLISGTYSAIKSISQEVQFGISPQVNLENDLKMGADVFTWGSTSGYVDYLCPQAYVSLNHPVLPFDTAVKKWRDLVKLNNIKLYYGLGVYKAMTDADQGTWKSSNDILMKEIECGRRVGCDGFMFYAWDSLVDPNVQQEVQNVMKVLK